MATFKEYEKVSVSALIKYGLDKLFEPGQVFEVRIPRQAGRTISGYFDDTGIAAALIESENRKAVDTERVKSSNGDKKWIEPKPSGIYVTLNPVTPALVARSHNVFDHKAAITTTDGEIIARRWLPIDLDPVRPSGISSTDEELQAARDKADEIRAWLESLGWPEPIQARSGNGAHLLYRIDLPNDEDARQLCEYSTKMIAGLFSDDRVNVDTTVWNASRIWKVYGTVAAKGSSTPDRPHRVAMIDASPSDIQPVRIELLQAMANGIRNSTADDFKDQSGEYIPDMEKWLLERGHKTTSGPRPFGDGGKKWTIAECPFNTSHKNPMVALNNNSRPVFKCLHNSCSAFTWKDFREKIDPTYSDPAAIKARIIDWCVGSQEAPSPELLENIFELKKIRSKTLNEIKKIVPKPRYALLSEAINEEARQRRINSIGEFNDKGNIVGLVQRTRVLQQTGEVPLYWMSSFDFRIRVGDVGDIRAERYEEIHDIKLMLKYHERNDIWVKTTHAGQVIKELAAERTVNPMRIHLKSYKWDGTQRLSTWLPRYMGTIDNEYTRAVGRKWMISAAARGMDPGCQADHMLILEGEQGIGKSQCLRALGGDFYIEYSRAVSGATSAHKDMVASVIGKLIVEMSELATLRRGDMETLKAILTTTHDDARLAYERDSRTYPRTCVFAGTTNELEGNYIADYSGARRFWPVRCGVIGKPDITALRAMRDQLWAEAVHAYEAGEDWYVVPQEMVKAEQAERQTSPQDADPWYDVIMRHLRDEDAYKNDVFQPVTRFEEGQPTEGVVVFAGPFDVMLNVALNIGTEHQTLAHAVRLRAILRAIGFQKRRSRRAVSGSGNQHQLREEWVEPAIWEKIADAVQRSGVTARE